MTNNNINLSIVIVNYKVENELIACISSIVESDPKVLYEIIVVDNNDDNSLKKTLKNKFPQVKYIKSPGNIGYGAGNNLGVKVSNGQFLFFLNPDTIIGKNSIDTLYNFMKNNTESGMVAPLLHNPKGDIYPQQGSYAYTFLKAIVVLSFINKLFPNNIISNNFFHNNWNKKNNEEFDVVPGTAFFIKRNLFEKVGMFDEKLFLYFEEYDLAKRIKKAGYKNYIIPKAKVIHIWEASTKKSNNIKKIFSKSRYYFFKKNYGIIKALLIELFSRTGKSEFFLGFIIASASFFGFFKIRESMPFIGDQGWFYLSARDMLLNGQIPLVGIASSHPWLHQGPLWTYILALFLRLFNFDPISGAYPTIIFGLLSVIGIYVVGLRFFSKRIGIIASLLYSTSPLVIYYMKFSYHTSPIPFFVIILIFSLFNVLNGKIIYVPFTFFLLGILYNFEVATVIIWPVFFGVLGYIIKKNKNNFTKLFGKKILLLSILSIAIPLFPIILYDIRNGFPQTLKFTAWLLYRAVSVFNYGQQGISIKKISTMLIFLFDNFRKLIFAESNLISLLILIFVMGWIIYRIFHKDQEKYKFNLLFLIFFIPFFFIILNQTPADAYLPILFPTTILLFTISIDRLFVIKKMFIPAIILLIIIVFGNIYFMFKNDFTLDKSSNNLFTLDKRILAVKEIINIADGKDYNLKGKGPGSKFESFTMNYEYLVWWMGHGPSKNDKELKIYVSESSDGVRIEKLTK